jgi:hypothetical protein
MKNLHKCATTLITNLVVLWALSRLLWALPQRPQQSWFVASVTRPQQSGLWHLFQIFSVDQRYGVVFKNSVVSTSLAWRTAQQSRTALPRAHSGARGLTVMLSPFRPRVPSQDERLSVTSLFGATSISAIRIVSSSSQVQFVLPVGAGIEVAWCTFTCPF